MTQDEFRKAPKRITICMLHANNTEEARKFFIDQINRLDVNSTNLGGSVGIATADGQKETGWTRIQRADGLL